MSPLGSARTFFEDVEVGTRHETPAMTVTDAHVAMYSGLTGDRAPATGLAPEVLALCLSTGLGWRIERPPLVVLAFMGIEWKVERALHVGDTIRSRSQTMVKRSLRDAGVVVEEHSIVDQREQVLQHGRFTFLVAKRPAA